MLNSNIFKKIMTALLLIWIFFAVVMPVSADPSRLEYLTSLSIEELMKVKVSSTGFFDMSHQKAPGTIWILSNEQIENSSAMNISDLLNFYIPGIHVGNNVRFGALVASRGISMPNNSSTLFLLDGQGINEGSGVGVNSGLKLPLLGDIDRLEVINGPCSIVHGSGAINGFVNIKTKNGSQYPGYFINTEYGFIEKLIKTEIGYGYSYGHKKDIFIYTGGAYSDGFEDEIEVNQTEPGHKTAPGEKPLDVYGMKQPNYKWALYWNHNLVKLNLLFQREIYENNSYYNFLSETSESEQTSLIVHPGIRFNLTRHEDLIVSLPFEFYDTGVHYDNIKNKDDEGSSEFHIEAKTVFKTTRFKNQKIAFGSLIGLRHFRAGKFYFSEDPLEPGASVDADWLEQSIFFEDIYRITPKWTVSAGVRYDIISYSSASSSGNIFVDTDYYDKEDDDDDIAPDNEDIITPRIATSYELNPFNIIKFSFQEGFHYPNLKYFEFTRTSGEELKPEKVQSFELNYHYNFEKYKAEFDFNIYYNIFSDSFLARTIDEDEMLDKPSENFDAYKNASEEFAALGGELTVRWQPVQDTTLRFSYGYSRPQDHGDQIISIADKNGTEWTRYPEHIVKTDITQKFLDNRLTSNLAFLYNSPTDTNDPETSRIFDHSRFIINLYSRYRITDSLSIKLIAQNLLENDVPPASNYIGPDWNANSVVDEPLFYLGLSWKY